MKQNTIALIEGGRGTSDQTIFAICREFNVNEQWLRTGEGEMFIPEATDALEELVRERGLSHSDYILMEKFLALRPEERQVVFNYALQVAAAFNAEESPPAAPAFAPAPKPDYEAEARAEAEEYYREILEEKKRAADRSASSGSFESDEKMA